MRRPNQLVIESAVIVSVMVALTLGGSIVTTTVPGSFLPLQNPTAVSPQHDLAGLALYYNTTLTQIGRQNFANASFLLGSFRFVNIPSNVNGTAQAANADLISVNVTIPKAQSNLTVATVAIQANQLVNATTLTENGCALVSNVEKSLADFSGPQTASLQSESVPTDEYAPGLSLVLQQVKSLQQECISISAKLPATGTSVLLIGSHQKTIETGGPVELFGNLTKAGAGVAGQQVLFYTNGSYFGSLFSDSHGAISGTLDIPFVYSDSAAVAALVAPNSTIGISGAQSNELLFLILFNQTSVVIGDPPAYLPGEGFSVHGNLTTTSGIPLPGAPVTVTYLRDSVNTTTDDGGKFGARFTVPNNATDGTYYVYARFSPRGVYGPSFNFTSIDVYHLSLNLALSVPKLSLAGFSTQIEGTATTNGTAVANAAVMLDSPWGRFNATTDSTGHFNLVVPISPLELAFSRNVTVAASPSQPYIAGSTVVTTLGLFNMLVVILPAAFVVVAGYEANSLGVFNGLSARLRRQPEEETMLLSALEKPSQQTLSSPDNGPEPLRLFGRALVLASSRFSLVFRPSDTIRDIISMIETEDDGEAFVAFSRILLTAEDFLYGKRFDSTHMEEARKALTELEVLWS